MVTSRTAVLLALRQGPGYGRELVRRLCSASEGQLRLAEGSIYPALRRLERAGLVRGWIVVPGRRPGGRSRHYYELTIEGVREAEARARVLARLAQLGVSGPNEAALAAMRSRAERVSELFASLTRMRDSLAHQRRRA